MPLQQTELSFPDSNKGFTCKCCGSFCKTYHKPLIGSAAADLIRLVKEYNKIGEAVHISWFTKQRSNFYTLSYWGLIEKGEVEIDKKKRSSGYWKPTEKGVLFVNNQLEIPSIAQTYNNKLVTLSGNKMNIIQALKKQFDYQKLMEG